jgi:hypothetical protein
LEDWGCIALYDRYRRKRTDLDRDYWKSVAAVHDGTAVKGS